MADRITRDNLRNFVDQLNEWGYAADGGRLIVEWAYGKPRVYWQPDGETWLSEVSPRLSTPDLYYWLRAYQSGFDVAKQKLEGKK